MNAFQTTAIEIAGKIFGHGALRIDRHGALDQVISSGRLVRRYASEQVMQLPTCQQLLSRRLLRQQNKSSNSRNQNCLKHKAKLLRT